MNAYQALPGSMTQDLLATALIQRTIYVRQSGEDTQTIDLQTSLMIADGTTGNLFLYDAADAVTAHDGVSCFVDASGRRYKLVGALTLPRSVLDRLGTPPGSPSVGDAYLVTAGATGAWAGQDDDLAVYTAQGWAFISPRVGLVVLVEDETAFYHYTAAGAWTAGMGSLALTSGDVTPIETDYIGIPPVIATLNTPPGSPTEGQRWLVGTAGTGAWVGHNNELATWRSGAWVFTSPHAGATVWDTAAGSELRYEGSAWAAPGASASGAVVLHDTYDFAVSGHATTIDFAGIAGAAEVLVILESLTGSGNTGWGVQLSTDDGSSFETAGTDYDVTGGTAAQMPIIASGFSSPWRAVARLTAFNMADVKTQMNNGTVDAGQRAVPEANNALRVVAISPAGLTVTSGKIHIITIAA